MHGIMNCMLHCCLSSISCRYSWLSDMSWLAPSCLFHHSPIILLNRTPFPFPLQRT
jgi:hypothetical protein